MKAATRILLKRFMKSPSRIVGESVFDMGGFRVPSLDSPQFINSGSRTGAAAEPRYLRFSRAGMIGTTT